MDRTDAGLDRLCKVYLGLNDGEKEKIIRLAEGLLESQKSVCNEILKSKDINSELKSVQIRS